MDKQQFYEKTKCPLCKIGFPLNIGDGTPIHLDIVWSSEAGQAFTCQDQPTVLALVKEGGQGDIFKELNNDFHEDPSFFSKENTSESSFFALTGEFIRYSGYMDDRRVREDINPSEVAEKLFEEGKNLKEVIDAVTQEDKDD